MVLRAGIPLIDLFDATDQVTSALPQDIAEFIRRFSIIDHRATRSSGALIHHGSLQSFADVFGQDAGDFDIGIGTLSLPLVNGALPFQLSMTRTAVTGAATSTTAPMEPAAEAWQLSIKLHDFSLSLNGLEPAIYVKESGTLPQHLLRDPAGGSVRIIGSATLRITRLSGGGVVIGFADQADPLDPTLSTGGVANLVVSPPHFFFGSSEVGMSIGPLLFDFSDTYSPQQILEADQGPQWVGMLIRQAMVYAPRNLPLVGDLSAGVRDVLIGNPLGIQGMLELQFGRTPLNPNTFQFRQELEGANLAVSSDGPARIVTLEGSQTDDFTIHAGFTATGSNPSWVAEWSFDAGPTTRGVTATGSVRHGSVLRVNPIETTGGTDIRQPEVSFRFVAAGEGAEVSASIGANSYTNVIHVNGTVDDLADVTFNTSSTAPGMSSFRWVLEAKSISQETASLTLDVSGLSGEHDLKLIETTQNDGERVTHVRIKIIDSGNLLVGTQGGVFDDTAPTTVLDLSAVLATIDLSDYHAAASITSKPDQATLDAGEAAKVFVPADSIAQVTIADPGLVSPDVFDRHVQVIMRFEEDVILGWGPIKPQGVSSASGETNLQTQLLHWASHYPDSDFIVIGRCDDIGTGHPNDNSVDSFNRQLARDRARKGKDLLTTVLSGASGTPIATNRILTRGESSDWDSEVARGDALEADPSIQPVAIPDGITDAGKSSAITDPAKALGWLIKHDHDGQHQSWRNAENTDQEDLRQSFRRVDIFAVGGSPTRDARRGGGETLRSPSLRYSWVPSGDRTPVSVAPSSPKLDYRVKLQVGWSSPTVASWKDAVPALVEAEFAWTPAETPLPDFDDAPVPVQTASEVLTVFAKWVHDSRTEFTRLTLGIRSDGDPDGLASTDQKNLTAVAALGPVLLSGVDFDTDMVGSAARLTALGAGVGAAGSILQNGSKTALIAIEAEAQTRALSDPGEDYQIELTAEYTTTLHVDVDLGIIQLSTAENQPMKIRYKNVGVAFDSSKTGWEQVGFAYDTDSMEIEDAGRWQINGVLGELLRIVEVAMGRGSLWLELRIAVALDLGIIEVSEVIIRVIFEDGPASSTLPRFELRGFVLKADIPGVLKGEGRVRIEDGGIIRAGVEAEIIPLAAGANAAIAFAKITDPTEYIFLSLFLGVQFSTPIPLAQSGAALYGFKGLFTMNGSRKLPNVDDPIKRELDWWNEVPENKYEPDHGQYAIGVGVVVGTMPDVSFCFSASGMVVVAFPDPEVILGVDVKIIEVPDTTARDKRPSEGTITGLIVIDDEAVTVAVSAQYTIPEVLELKIPFGAYFPYSGNGVYVRIGSDGEEGRFGEPITLRLLPTTLDVNAWAYLMIEQDGLQNLGGDSQFSFDGFSVGFGAGFGIEWSAGPISLSASAKVLVGFGTNPLLIKGGVFFAGELDLVVISISASATLILTYLDGDVFVEGEVCGEVDLFFFSIEGCVGVEFGTRRDADEVPPAPENPIASISMVDRRDRIMGTASLTSEPIQGNPLFDVVENGDSNGHPINNGRPIEENQTLWPDTAPVLHFKHYVKNNATSQFDIPDTPSQPIWFGGNRLKYTYRIDDVRLVRKRDKQPVASLTSAALQSTWMTTPYKAPGSDGDNDNPLPSEHEGPNLKLLDWNPWAWVVNTPNGGEGTAGDPAGQIADICDPKSQPRLACVFARAATGLAWNAVYLKQETLATPPYPSRFYGVGKPVLRMANMKIEGRDLHTLFQAFGSSIKPGLVEDLPFAHAQNGETLKKGYRLPRAERATPTGFESRPLPWEISFDRNLTRPSIRLLICDLTNSEPEKNCVEFNEFKTVGKATVLQLDDIVMRSVAQDDPLVLSDRVNTSLSPDGLGQDGIAEVSVPKSGMRILFRRPCTQIELWFMPRERVDIKVTGRTTDARDVGPVSARGIGGVPMTARLNDPAGIASVLIEGSSGLDVLYRICCSGEGDVPDLPGNDECERFAKLKPDGDAVSSFKYKGFEFESRESQNKIRFSDTVDQRTTPARFGSDGSGEIGFPDTGMIIVVPEPCVAVELGLMVFHPNPVKLSGFDAAGKLVAKEVAPNEERVAHTIRLTSKGQPIVRIELDGGGFEAVLFRICCLGASGTGEICQPVDVRIDNEVQKITIGKILLEALGRKGFSSADEVDANKQPAVPGQDGRNELVLPDDGVRITLLRPCARVRIKVMLFGSDLKAIAFDASGAAQDENVTNGEQKTEIVMTFTGKEISVIELFGGSNEALLFEICCLDGALDVKPGTLSAGSVFIDPMRRREPVAATQTIQEADLVVKGIQSDKPADTWQGKVIETRQTKLRECRVIEFTPEPGAKGPWGGIQVVSALGKKVTLLSICGVDQLMQEARDADEAARQDLIAQFGTVLGGLFYKRREVLLEPGESYQIEVDWCWQYWRTNEEGTNSAPEASALREADWRHESSVNHHFKVADIAADTDVTQDGLNEYVFDARDLSRHLTAIEPVDGRSVHFTDDPVWVHFDSGHIEGLAEKYGRELRIVVRRTDPAPQSTPADLIQVLKPLTGTQIWHQGPLDLEPVGYQRISEALEKAPCLPEANPGGASLGGEFELQPRAMYDLELRAPLIDSDNDSVLVSGTRFITSRYANPREMLTAMGYGESTPLSFGPDDLILPEPANLPNGALESSDSLIDAFLDSIDAGTLPLPRSRAQTYALWRLNGTRWQIEGLLLDALESLYRTSTQITTTGTVIGPRCVLSNAQIGTQSLTPVITNANWTRVLLVPDSPITLVEGKHELMLSFTTQTAPVTGRRVIAHQPAMIQREGF